MSEHPSIVAMSLTACKHDFLRLYKDEANRMTYLICVDCDEFWDAQPYPVGKEPYEYVRRKEG